MSSAVSERRRTQRFVLNLPVRIVKLRRKPVEIRSETRNLSSVGAYFCMSGAEPTTGSSIEFFVTLKPNSPDSVELHCRGRVVRVERLGEDSGVGVGASIDRYQFVRPQQG